jgi:hypothetical protein
MVLLTMTSSIVEALIILGNSSEHHDPPSDSTRVKDKELKEPCLKDPAVGNPISHEQIIDTWNTLKVKGHDGIFLEEMLRGATIYVPPPIPKLEPVRLIFTPLLVRVVT